MEAAVTAVRIAASEGKGAVFAPLAKGGAGGLRAVGPPAERLRRWLGGMETACLTAMQSSATIASMEARGLICEMTGQGRYRMWRAVN